MAERICNIIIPVFNHSLFTDFCLQKIFQYWSPKIKSVIVVNNNSSDDTVEILKYYSENYKPLIVINNSLNVGFARAMNQGIVNDCDSILLNNDVHLTPNWVDNLVKCAYSSVCHGLIIPWSNDYANKELKKIAQANKNAKSLVRNVKSKQDLINYTNNLYGGNFLNWIEAFQTNDAEEVTKGGYCIYVKKNTVRKCGILDESFSEIGSYADQDYIKRVKLAGLKVIKTKSVYIHHFGHITLGDGSFNEEELHKAERIRRRQKKY